jgi:hypothetical protein
MPCYYALPDEIIDVISKMVHQMSYRGILEDIVSGVGVNINLRITVSWQPIFTTHEE